MKIIHSTLLALSLFALAPALAQAQSCAAELADAVMEGLSQDIYRCDNWHSGLPSQFCHESAARSLRETEGHSCVKTIDMTSGYRRLNRIQISREFSQPESVEILMAAITQEGYMRNILAAFMYYKGLEKVRITNHSGVIYHRVGRDVLKMPGYFPGEASDFLAKAPVMVETTLRLEELLAVRIQIKTHEIPDDFDGDAIVAYFARNQESIAQLIWDLHIDQITFGSSGYVARDTFFGRVSNDVRIRTQNHSPLGDSFTMAFIQSFFGKEEN